MSTISNKLSELGKSNSRNFAIARFSGFLTDSLIEVTIVLVAWSITQDSFLTALVTLSARVPAWLFGLIGGILSDRHSTRKLIVYANLVIISASTFLIVIFLISGEISVYTLSSFAFLVATARTFDAPALFKQVKEVSTDDTINLLNAISDFGKRASRIIAPFLLTLITGAYSYIGVFFIIPLLSMLVIVFSLKIVGRTQQVLTVRRRTIARDLIEASLVLRNNVPLFSAISIDAIFSVGYQAIYWVILPRHLLSDLNMENETYAISLTFLAIGGLGGSVLSGFVPMIDKLRVVYISKITGLICFATICYFLDNIYSIYLGAAIVGFLLAFERVAMDGYVQSSSPADMIGKVYAFWRLFVELSGSVGIAVIGYSIEQKGVPSVTIVLIPICACIMTLLYFLARAKKEVHA